MDEYVAAVQSHLALAQEEVVLAIYALEGIEMHEDYRATGPPPAPPPATTTRRDIAAGAFAMYALLDLLTVRVPGPLSLLGVDRYTRLFDHLHAAMGVLPV